MRMRDDAAASPQPGAGRETGDAGEHGQAGEAGERRDFFKAAALGAGVAALAGALHGKYAMAPLISEAHAQTGPNWWPSRWGKDDEAGASNWMTPEKVLDAVKWIRDGRLYRIGRVYEAGMPTFGARQWSLRIPGGPTGGPFGENKLVYNDEFLATEIGQVGTQFDGLGHIGIQMGKDGDKTEMRFYNGFTSQEINGAYGLNKLGAEKVKPFFTRAHLIDVAVGKTWDVGQEVKMADVRAALERQKMREADIKPGDGVFFNTGWGALWMKANDRYNSGEPGIGLEVARWLVERQVAVTGADNWANEVVPNPDKRLAFPVHGELITKNGIFNHENLNFDELIKDKKYQFVYVFSPMPIKGATGSAGGPLAMT
jgi:kynurenine formamidase